MDFSPRASLDESDLLFFHRQVSQRILISQFTTSFVPTEKARIEHYG